MKKEDTVCEKIFAKHIPVMGLCLKYTRCLKFNRRKQTTLAGIVAKW
jgi:hypothetical protein